MSEGRNIVSIALALLAPPTKSEPAYCCLGLEVMKTLRSSAKPAPERAG